MALDGSGKHAVRVIARVDSVLDVEAELLAPVLDHAHHLAREPLELQLLTDHRVELHLGRAERDARSEEHTSELQSQSNLVCRLLLEKKTNPAVTRENVHRLHRSLPPAPILVSVPSLSRIPGRSPRLPDSLPIPSLARSSLVTLLSRR